MGCALILASHVPSGCSSSAEARALGFTLTWIVLTGARAAGCSSHGRGGHMLAPFEDDLRRPTSSGSTAPIWSVSLVVYGSWCSR